MRSRPSRRGSMASACIGNISSKPISLTAFNKRGSRRNASKLAPMNALPLELRRPIKTFYSVILPVPLHFQQWTGSMTVSAQMLVFSNVEGYYRTLKTHLERLRWIRNAYSIVPHLLYTMQTAEAGKRSGSFDY